MEKDRFQKLNKENPGIMKENKKKTLKQKSQKFFTIEEYHKGFPKNIQKLLEEIRQIIKKAAPEAIETISYNIPTFKLNTNLVHYAAYKNHIGFYPTPLAIIVFKEDLMNYKTSKGAIQFPIDQDLPKNLIRKIVLFRVLKEKENLLLKKT